MQARLVSLDYQVPDCDPSLAQLPVTIGRSPDAGIHLEDYSASHYHCRIAQIDGQLVVLDLGSVHGTFVNGTRISESPLMPGDSLGIGMLSFFLQCTQESESSLPIGDRTPTIAAKREPRAALVHAAD